MTILRAVDTVGRNSNPYVNVRTNFKYIAPKIADVFGLYDGYFGAVMRFQN